MADAIGMLHDLVRRVTSLEEGKPPQPTRAPARSRVVLPADPDSAAIIRYLQTSHTKTAEDRDVAAIRTWLTTRKQKR